MSAEAWTFLGIVATGLFGLIGVYVQHGRRQAKAAMGQTPKPETTTNSTPLDPLEAAVSKALDRVTDLLEDTTKRLDEVQRQLGDTQRQLAEKKAEVRSLEDENREYEYKIRELQSELSSMKAQLSAATAELNVLRRQVMGAGHER